MTFEKKSRLQSVLVMSTEISQFEYYSPMPIGTWDEYRKKYIPLRIAVYDTDFDYIVVKRGKKYYHLLFKCLEHCYFIKLPQTLTLSVQQIEKHTVNLYIQIFGLQTWEKVENYTREQMIGFPF